MNRSTACGPGKDKRTESNKSATGTFALRLSLPRRPAVRTTLPLKGDSTENRPLVSGYRLEFQGRTNKKGQPVRDLVIDEFESCVVKDIFRLITVEGYGTNKVAAHLNKEGIRTKRGTTLWRGTSIRAIISNPIYKASA